MTCYDTTEELEKTCASLCCKCMLMASDQQYTFQSSQHLHECQSGTKSDQGWLKSDQSFWTRTQ